MKKHFVTFFSPGTFFAEQTTEEIDSWDVEKARAMAKEIVERHNSRPYCFRFTTRERGPADFNSRETKSSPRYFLGGVVKTLEEVKAENDPENRVLIGNMEGNGWNRIVTTCSPYKWTQPLENDDVVLSEEG